MQRTVSLNTGIPFCGALDKGQTCAEMTDLRLVVPIKKKSYVGAGSGRETMLSFKKMKITVP